ncbi:MAG: hypothetical protein D6675_12285 [Gemmatimonadetes bacterium]|nr:MAG: hypothetical protein D6675_12285 [Gemmatimonadota bacterium]
MSDTQQLELGLPMDYHLTVLRNKQGQPRIFIVPAATEKQAKWIVCDYLGYEPDFFDVRGKGTYRLPGTNRVAEGYWLRII